MIAAAILAGPRPSSVVRADEPASVPQVPPAAAPVAPPPPPTPCQGHLAMTIPRHGVGGGGGWGTTR